MGNVFASSTLQKRVSVYLKEELSDCLSLKYELNNVETCGNRVTDANLFETIAFKRRNSLEPLHGFLTN